MNAPPAKLIESLKALPRPVWFLCLGTFLNKFGAFVIPFLALYMTRLGFSKTDAGFAIAAYGVGQIFASIIGGYLADRIGRRHTMALSMFSGAATMMWLSQARTFAEFLWLSAITGLASELYRPACSALLADLAPPRFRVTAYSAYRWALNAGWAFGPATAGFLAKYSFFWLFVGDALTSILFGVVAWFLLPHGVRSAKHEAGWSSTWRQMAWDRPFLRTIGASFAISLVFLQMSTTFGLYVTSLGFAPATYGILISLNGLLVVLFELPLTTITRLYSPPKMIALGFGLISAGFGLLCVAHALPMLVVSMVIFTAGEMVCMPVTSAYIAELAPIHLRGRYAGAYSFVWSLGLVVGPPLGMALLSFSPGALWLACAGIGFFAAWMVSRIPFLNRTADPQINREVDPRPKSRVIRR